MMTSVSAAKYYIWYISMTRYAVTYYANDPLMITVKSERISLYMILEVPQNSTNHTIIAQFCGNIARKSVPFSLNIVEKVPFWITFLNSMNISSEHLVVISNVNLHYWTWYLDLQRSSQRNYVLETNDRAVSNSQHITLNKKRLKNWYKNSTTISNILKL